MDFKEIKSQIKQVLEYSQSAEISDEYIEELVSKWWENKKEFVEYFNGQLIYEIDDIVTFEVNPIIKKENYKDFCEGISNMYRDNPNLISFLEAYSEDDFYKNSLSHDYEGKNGIYIPKGSKFLRSLKHFIEDPNALDKIQTHASQLIQEGKVTGKFCISIHPLDYLSSSENSYHWRSCHSLDGDYRAGNLAYMMDKSTLVCYIKSEHGDTYINNFGSLKWNTKKWRMLIFISEDRNLMFAGRQYPFAIEGILDHIINDSKYSLPFMSMGIRKNPRHWCSWSPWDNYQLTSLPDKYLESPYIYIEHKLYNIRDIIKHGGKKTPTYYNDLLFSSCYTPYYCYNIFSKTIHEAKIVIGEDIPCASGCGEHLENSDTFFCDECDDSDCRDGWFCEECGRWSDVDDITWVEGVPLCPECADELTAYCDNCGEILFKEHVVYCSDTKDYRCPNCCSHRLFRED